MELVAQSEYSGVLMGGASYWAMELDETDVSKFVARWEDGNDKSIDSRFQCFVSPYTRWFAGISRVQVFAGVPPPSETAYRWVISKAGLFWLQGDFNYGDDPTEFEEGPYQQIRRDDLWRVQQSCPSIELGVGEFVLAGGVNMRGGKQICIFDYFVFEDEDFTHPVAVFDDTKKLEFVQQIKTALRLPNDAEVTEYSD